MQFVVSSRHHTLDMTKEFPGAVRLDEHRVEPYECYDRWLVELPDNLDHFLGSVEKFGRFAPALVELDGKAVWEIHFEQDYD